jgi:hypothetical protein
MVKHIGKGEGHLSASKLISTEEEGEAARYCERVER